MILSERLGRGPVPSEMSAHTVGPGEFREHDVWGLVRVYWNPIAYRRGVGVRFWAEGAPQPRRPEVYFMNVVLFCVNFTLFISARACGVGHVFNFIKVELFSEFVCHCKFGVCLLSCC